MIEPARHPYANLISAWLKDMSQKIEGKSRVFRGFSLTWKEVTIEDVLSCTSENSWDFRLKNEEENRIKSSLTDNELLNLYWGEQNELAGTIPQVRSGNLANDLRPIADGAAQRAIADLRNPSYDWINSVFKDTDEEVIAKAISSYLHFVKHG